MLTFGRDRLGRRSLLHNSQDLSRRLVIASVAPNLGRVQANSTDSATATHSMQEVDCDGLHQINLADVSINAQLEIDWSQALKRIPRSDQASLFVGFETFLLVPHACVRLIEGPLLPDNHPKTIPCISNRDGFGNHR